MATLNFKSIKIIAEAMSQVTSLTHVDLNIGKVDDSVATDLGNFMTNNHELTEVKFSKLQLQCSGYEKLSKHLDKMKGLKYISIRNAKNIITNSLTKLIDNNKRITYLNLSNSSISNWEMLQFTDVLQDVHSLQYLNLSRVYISDPQVVENIRNLISRNAKLKHLQLAMAGCMLNDIHIKELVAPVKLCSDLVLLNLSDNNIASSSTIKELKELLTTCNNIKYLYLANCSLGTAELQNITAALQCNAGTALKFLDLRCNDIQMSYSQQEIDMIITIIINRKLQSILLPTFNAVILQSLLIKLRDVNSLRYLDFGSNQLTNVLAREVATLITSSNYINLQQLTVPKLVLQQNEVTYLSNSKLKIRGINILTVMSCSFNRNTWNFFKHVMKENKHSIDGLSLTDCVVLESIGEVIRFVTKLQCLRLNNITVVIDIQEKAQPDSNNAQLHISQHHKYHLADNSNIIANPLYKCYRRNLRLLNLSNNYLAGKAIEQMITTIVNFSSLEYLEVANCGLTAKEIIHFTYLCTLIQLKHIDLRCNAITDEGAESIAKLISNTSQLQHLNLSNCGFQSKGLHIIAEALNMNAKLNHVDLSLNGKINYQSHREGIYAPDSVIEKTINMVLNNSNMQELKLPQVLLSNKHLKCLFEIFASKKSFKYIDLGPNEVSDGLAKDLAAVLFSNSKLEKLLLTTLKLEHGFAELKYHLTKITGLLHLSINFCSNLTDQDADIIIATIGNNRSMKTFDLCDCTPNEISIKSKLKLIDALTGLGTLEYLLLNNFPCAAAMGLANVIICNANLKNIELAGCNLDLTGCKCILNAINQCKDVTCLNFSYNANIGQTEFIMPDVFMNNKNLMHIDVSVCNFTSKRITELCQVLRNCKNLKYLNLSHNSNVGQVADEIVSLLFFIRKLEYLNLYNCRLEPTGIKNLAGRLKEFSTLQYVYLSFNKMSDDAVDEIAAMLSNNTNMKKITLPEYDHSYTCIKVILTAMKTLSSLEYVDISCAQVIVDAAMELGDVLINNSNLQQVLVSQLELDPSTYTKLGSNLCKIRELRHLSISLTAINDEDANNVAVVIANNSTIEKLNLSGCKISLQGKIHIFKAFTSLASLQCLCINKVDITDQIEDDLAKVLSKNVALKHFEMGGCIAEIGISKIIKSLKNHKELKYLNFNDNIISESNMMDLFNLIERNKTEHLKLSKCNITNLDVIFKLLAINTIKHLDLSHNPISSIATTITRQSKCTTNFCLTYFNLSDCNMSERNTEQVIKFVTQSSLLYHLDLSSNLLQSNSSAARDLVTLISNNKSIESLYLPVCTLSNFDIKALFVTLRNVSSLRFVDLHSHCITNEMADDVAAMMNNNKNLNTLKVSSITLTESGFKVLKSSLQKIKGLNYLTLTGCKITDENAMIIAALINNNLFIQELNISNCMPTCIKDLHSIFFAMNDLKSLRLLYFVYNHQSVPIDGIDDLRAVINANAKLKAIGLGGYALTEPNIIAIIKAIKYPQNITHVMFEDASLNTPIIMTLSDLQVASSGLEHLGMSNCMVTTKEICHWKGILKTSKLRYLNVSNNGLGGLGIELIQNMIVKAKQLQYLNLSNCLFQPEQLVHILVRLQEINSLQYLNMNGNNLTDGMAPMLVTVILRNIEIKHLCLSNCKLTHSEVTDLVNAMKRKTSLKSIDISFNEINYSMLNKGLIDILNGNRCLELVILSRLELRQHELQIISKILPLVRKLEHFSITGCGFSHTDACNVATLISNNKSLKYIKISDCVVSDNEKLKIFVAMTNVTSLTHIILNNVAITNQAKDVISAVIINNTELQHIEMTRCLNIGFVKSISTMINNHRHIKSIKII